jgi:hypothetical protein
MTAAQHGVITALKAQIEALPLRRRGANRVDALGKYLTLVRTAAESVVELRGVRDCTQLVFPDAPLEASGRALGTARARALTLLGALATADDIEEPSVERGLADLRRLVQTADREVRTEWRQQVEAVAARYGRLINALHEARVQGSGTLRAAVERVQRMDTPPTSRAGALRAAEDIGGVAAAVRDLGLEGPVGEFLTAAADKRAAASSLRHPEVAAFLDRHDLWGVLVVGLR